MCHDGLPTALAARLLSAHKTPDRPMGIRRLRRECREFNGALNPIAELELSAPRAHAHPVVAVSIPRYPALAARRFFTHRTHGRPMGIRRLRRERREFNGALNPIAELELSAPRAHAHPVVAVSIPRYPALAARRFFTHRTHDRPMGIRRLRRECREFNGALNPIAELELSAPRAHAHPVVAVSIPRYPQYCTS